jgi:hypothetical protein
MNEIEVAIIGQHPDGTSKRAAVVTDRQGGRAWSGEGATDDAAATNAVRKFLKDRNAREYVG